MHASLDLLRQKGLGEETYGHSRGVVGDDHDQIHTSAGAYCGAGAHNRRNHIGRLPRHQVLDAGQSGIVDEVAREVVEQVPDIVDIQLLQHLGISFADALDLRGRRFQLAIQRQLFVQVPLLAGMARRPIQAGHGRDV